MQGHKVTEVVGKPGQAWGTVFFPTTGTISVKIAGDLIQAIVKSGLEKNETFVRIQHIDSIHVSEAPNYAVLLFGGLLALMGLLPILAYGAFPIRSLFFLVIGLACVGLALRMKRRLLVIHSVRTTVPVFMTKPTDSYQQFASHVMAIARQLNGSVAPAHPPAVNPTSKPASSNQPRQPRSHPHGP